MNIEPFAHDISQGIIFPRSVLSKTLMSRCFMSFAVVRVHGQQQMATTTSPRFRFVRPINYKEIIRLPISLL